MSASIYFLRRFLCNNRIHRSRRCWWLIGLVSTIVVLKNLFKLKLSILVFICNLDTLFNFSIVNKLIDLHLHLLKFSFIDFTILVGVSEVENLSSLFLHVRSESSWLLSNLIVDLKHFFIFRSHCCVGDLWLFVIELIPFTNIFFYTVICCFYLFAIVSNII